jgi:hypothetical protein
MHRWIPEACLLAGTAIAVLATACGSGPEGQSDGEPRRQTPTASGAAPAHPTVQPRAPSPSPVEARTPPPAIGRPSDFDVPDGRRDDILAEASDFERPLLEDGTLTFAEYEQALFAGFACMEAKGVGVFHQIPRVIGGTVISDSQEKFPGPRLTARGQYRYVTNSGSLSLVEFQGIHAQCAAEYYALVEFLWAENVAPSEQDAQAMTSGIGDCLRELGLPVPANPSEDDLLLAAWPPDGHFVRDLHENPDGSPVFTVVAFYDCRIVTRFDMGFE